MREENTDLLIAVSSVFMGDYTSISRLLDNLRKRMTSVTDKIFYKKLECVMLGLDAKGINASEIRAKLSDSSYSTDFSEALLSFINEFESSKKSECMVNLIDSVCNDYITPNECMRFCWYLKKIPLPTLIFLKENISKVTLYNNEDVIITELYNNGLMYQSTNNGMSFSKEAYLLDKYGLSYLDEKKYIDYKDKYSGIPEKMPDKPTYFVTG